MGIDRERSDVSLFSLFRKPAWEHRDPARRAAAVASANDPELLARLPELVRHDAEPGVRLAALRRIDDLSLLGDRMRNDADANMRTVARQRYLHHLLDPGLALGERERVIAVEDDAEILATIAQQAPEAALRRLALERVNRPGLIAERCIKDPDASLRQWLLDRIDDLPTLERIAERARKGDKRLARKARERVQSARLASGDPDALRERALALCEELDALRRQAAQGGELEPIKTRRAELGQQWHDLKTHLDAAIERRVQGYFNTVDAVLEPAPARPPQVPDVAPELALPEPPPHHDSNAPAREPDLALAALLAELEARQTRLGLHELGELEKRWLERLRRIEPLRPEEHEQETRFRTLATTRRRELEQKARERQAAQQALPAALDALEAAIEAGHVSQAREQMRQIESSRSLLGDHFPRPMARRLGLAARQLDRLGQWQHWSGNKARISLIEAVEAVSGSGLHPDALAAKVKEYQARWQQLDETDARSQAHPLSRRFHAVCRQTLAPARSYFEKRRELRGARREQIQQVQEQLDADLSDTLPARELIALRRRFVEQLRRCDELEPAARREVARGLRERLGRIDALLAASEAEAEATKRKLLSNLKRDLQQAELDAALALAREAQAQWKRLPRAARQTEDELWRALRELIDPWFAQSDARQRERNDAEQARHDQARAILDELAQLAHDDEATPDQLESRLNALQARWRALAEQARAPTNADDSSERTPPRRSPRPARAGTLDERAFDRAVSRVEARREHQLKVRQQAELHCIAEAGALCDQLEALPADALQGTRASLRDRFHALSLPADARAPLQTRLRAALDPEGELPLEPEQRDPDTRADELTVLAELVCERESPAEAQALRRRLQIERLSERLSGGGAQNDELRPLLLHYASLHGVSPARRAALAARWQALLPQAESN